MRDQGLGVMAYSPLAVGLLSGRYTVDEPPPPGTLWDRLGDSFKATVSADVASVMETVRDVAAERGKTMAQVAINWVLSQPEITVAISGSDTIEQLDDNLGALGWELSDEELTRLDEVSRQKAGLVI